MDVEASPEVGAASAPSALTSEAATQFLDAPQGWQKKVVPRKGGTPKRGDVVFVAPNGEEIKTKRQLERHLKANPGLHQLSDFSWSTVETPRRSERLSTKTRKSIDSPDVVPLAKRARKTPVKPVKTSKEDEEDKEVTPMKEEDDKMLDILPSKEVTSPVELKENKETDGELCVVKESGRAETKEHSGVPEVESYSKGEGSERKDLEEAVPVEESMEDKETKFKTFEEPSYVRDSKHDAVKESEPSKDGLVAASKEEENYETNATKMEPNLFQTAEGVDTKMKDPAPVTDDYHEEVVIEEETTLLVEQTIVLEPPRNEKATSEDLESGENKNKATKDGEQSVTPASFPDLDIPIQDGHAEEIRTGSDHSKPNMTSFANATKPQEARPAEVGVSS